MSTALQVEGLSIGFGGLKAVDEISLTIEAGERRVLLGPNGAGKTTLFNLIGGQLRPDAGSVRLFGKDITRLEPFRRAAAGLARTFQITNLFGHLTVAENLHLAVQAFSPDRLSLIKDTRRISAVVDRLEQHLADWRFEAERDVRVADLSYGEQRKLEIAMALAHRPRVLLLDEPTAGLSTEETEKVVLLVNDLPAEVTVLIIEHDMDVAFAVGKRFTIMHQGRIVLDGDEGQVRSSSEIQAIYFGEEEA